MAHSPQTLPAGITAKDALALAAEAIVVARRRTDRFNQQIEWRDRKITKLEAEGRDAQVEELERKLRTAYQRIEMLESEVSRRETWIVDHKMGCDQF